MEYKKKKKERKSIIYSVVSFLFFLFTNSWILHETWPLIPFYSEIGNISLFD